MPELAEDLAPTTDDALLEQAEAKVRTYCRWHIAPSREETVTLYPDCYSTVLFLPSLYVTDVSLVTEGVTDLATTDYAWRTNGIIKRVSGWWSPEDQGVTVTFTHGYDEAPPDVTAVVQELAAIGSLGRLKSKSAGPFSETYSSDLNTVDASSLSAYRVPAV